MAIWFDRYLLTPLRDNEIASMYTLELHKRIFDLRMTILTELFDVIWAVSLIAYASLGDASLRPHFRPASLTYFIILSIVFFVFFAHAFFVSFPSYSRVRVAIVRGGY